MNKQIAAVTLLAALAVVATAYEFNDPVFNRLLANELEELEASLDEPAFHPRNRRDEEAVVHAEKCKSPKRKRMCCAEESFQAQHEKDKELRKECFKQVTGRDRDRGDFDPFKICENIKRHKREMTCMIQCVGQRKNVLDKDGNPNEDELAAFVKELMSKESWFAPIQDKVISTCLAEARNATANRDTSDSESCNPAGVKLAYCMFTETQLACPAEQIKDQKVCTKIRDKINRKEFFHAPPTFTDE